MRKTKIQWTDTTWNPIRGCARVSEGCRHCYAEVIAARFSGKGQPYYGLARKTASGEARWTGKVKLVEGHLEDPVGWRRPRRVFVNSMSDLFYEEIPSEWIDRIFDVMTRSPQHVFQVLTKRARRMLDYMSDRYSNEPLNLQPPDNVWLGVSVEDQESADERIPKLLRAPAAVRFLSVEPLIAPVNLDRLTCWYCFESFDPKLKPGRLEECPHCKRKEHRAMHRRWIAPMYDMAAINWVIIGGESGKDARRCDVDWVRTIVKQCEAAGVSCFVKQLGKHITWNGIQGGNIPLWPCGTGWEDSGLGYFEKDFSHKKGGDPTEWPEDLRVREFPK